MFMSMPRKHAIFFFLPFSPFSFLLFSALSFLLFHSSSSTHVPFLLSLISLLCLKSCYNDINTYVEVVKIKVRM